MKNNNPLSPHIQIYDWHISSLVSISHRIVGVVNFFIFNLLCLWVILISLNRNYFEVMNVFLNSYYGKFMTIGIIWSFSFHILSEIRHLIWDLGYGFNLKVSKISGAIVILGSFLMTILIYLIGRQLI
tara:strand:- start:1395 stop:1778 length:384 start_codon:yes stop_codon:yes gene_type:complete